MKTSTLLKIVALTGFVVIVSIVSGCAGRTGKIPDAKPAPVPQEPVKREPDVQKPPVREPRVRKPTPVPPADISLTIGYNAATRRVTSPHVVLDLAQVPDGNYPVWVSGNRYPGLLRAATHQRFTSGGYYGRGFSRFSPGDVNDRGRGEHYCGIGQIHGFDHAGDSSRMVVGQLIRFGTTFFTDQIAKNPPNGDIKQIIFLKDSGPRPMIITKGNRTRVLGACDGTVCNTTGSKTRIDYFNDGNHRPDLNRYLGQWLWVEFAINTHVPFLRVRTWSEDGTLQGNETIGPWGLGGRVTTLDIIGFVSGIPRPGTQPYYDLERVEFRIGSDANITPPPGFPGSTRWHE